MSERKQAIISGDAHSGANGGLVHPDFRGDVPRDILPHCESYYNSFNVTNREDWTWNAHVWRGLRRVNNLEL